MLVGDDTTEISPIGGSGAAEPEASEGEAACEQPASSAIAGINSAMPTM
jgi:hypothetical protein